MTAALSIAGLTARLGDLEILRGLDLEVPFGEIHALMGPNGSGKSTLCHVLMGKPGYEATGAARVAGTDLLSLGVDERARAGIFATFQYPVEIPGVTLDEFMDEIAAARSADGDVAARRATVETRLGMAPFLHRPVNEGLSGGEKKRSEIFQLLVLDPTVAVLDEIDSGLDIDAVREVAAAIEELRSPERGVLLITHYSRILRYLTVDRVHVMVGGRIVESGDAGLADRLEAQGYDQYRLEHGLAPAAPVAEPDPLLDL